MKKYYELLNISENASLEEARAAYKREVKKYHPDLYEGDKDFAENRTAEINVAFGMVTKDIEFRAEMRNEQAAKPNQPAKKTARETAKPKPKQEPKEPKTAPPKAESKPKPKREPQIKKTDFELFREKFGFPPEFEKAAKKPESVNAEKENPSAVPVRTSGGDVDYNSEFTADSRTDIKNSSAYARVTAEEFSGDNEIRGPIKNEKTITILDTYDRAAEKSQPEEKKKENQNGKTVLNLLLGGILVGVLIIIIMLAV